MKSYQHAAFSGYGIEIESMLVRKDTLDIAPIADQLLALVGGAEDMDVDRGAAAWSNELALHVIETKTAGPIFDLEEGVSLFRRQIDDILSLIEPLGARLMPTGMHPWMDPVRETRLWPHQNDEIYRAFDRIFGCQGHGWSNLQSTHINFPFQTAQEFHEVHAACRFVLPLLPALAASSPFQDGGRGRGLDSRLLAYQDNCRQVPSVTGRVIPEPVSSEAEYSSLLAGIYADMAPYDPEGVLAHEWLNARGAIARFDRGAVEIRVLDAQECPEQDLPVVKWVTEVTRALARGEYGGVEELDAWSPERLRQVFDGAVKQGGSAELGEYARVFRIAGRTARDAIGELTERFVSRSSRLRPGLDLIVEEGCLAERMVRRLPQAGRQGLFDLYLDLCNCMSRGVPFAG